ncbi:hypothetical protein [Chitinophaga rhizophila]|uniref:Uncharacterized protein n=1 Tax=Chitinophaga rhizophila TaxID=2866212 RepID=A0ABS7GBD3_9BACT|nr:hypothetical protein [Chitinophaga rhizophila]MBW8684726.1 hypothetical protein [Chitinophaga rhizophila]
MKIKLSNVVLVITSLLGIAAVTAKERREEFYYARDRSGEWFIRIHGGAPNDPTCCVSGGNSACFYIIPIEFSWARVDEIDPALVTPVGTNQTDTCQ